MYLIFFNYSDNKFNFFVARNVDKEEYCRPTYQYRINKKSDVFISNCNFREFAEWDDEDSDYWEFLTDNAGVTIDTKSNYKQVFMKEIFNEIDDYLKRR